MYKSMQLRKNRILSISAIAMTALTWACTGDVIINEERQDLCGNHILNEGEACDGLEFAEDAACPEGMVLPEGEVFVCTSRCELNTSNCVEDSGKTEDPQPTEACGNGQLEGNEECDGESFRETPVCPEGTQLADGQFISCLEDCSVDYTVCSPVDEPEPTESCGNGQLDEGEACDGDVIREDISCPAGTALSAGKSLTCTESCTIDYSVCENLCGNGQVDAGEECDKDQFAETPACPSGTTLLNGKSITCTNKCKVSYANCKAPCGNGQLESTEVCDGDLFAKKAACPSGMVLSAGKSLLCNKDCTLNTSNCIAACGNGQLDANEECDKDQFAKTPACSSGTTLLNGKSIGCSSKCKVDYSNCKTPCGNGQLDKNEVCDGKLMAKTAACPSGTVLLNGKSLSCNSDCSLNTSNCKAPCGNGQLDNGEACDGTLFASNAKCPAGKELPSGKSITCKKNCTLDTTACLDPCKTRIEYGSTWLHDASRTDHVDWADGVITWDGSCKEDGGNTYATLSNGWKPYFEGRTCLIALDYVGNCSGVENKCKTRVTYSSNWGPGPGHESWFYDDANGVVTWNGKCYNGTHATLSNGWEPYYKNGYCGVYLRYTQCGGLYTNPVLSYDNPDPGVMYDNGTYYMVGTGGKFPLHTSKDLISWKKVGTALSAQPTWASDSFWAPELHKVNDKYHIYYSARNKSSNLFCLGVGVADKPEGPYVDKGSPLHCKTGMGIIDANYFKDSDGKHYIIWKDDGNAVGLRTPFFIQLLAADGLSLTGSPKEILSNTLGFEGPLVEGPWLIKRGSYYYLFYSSNGYTSPSYNISVARSKNLFGPYEKKGSPLVGASSSDHFQGPGHGSVLQSPNGEWFHIYHTWVKGYVGYNTNGPGRIIAVDRIAWIDDWPMSYSAPLYRSQPPIR